MVDYRDPYPSWRERLKWLYVKYFSDETVPPKAHVKLKCPETGEVFGTEHTIPTDVEHDVRAGTGIWTYRCDECGDEHRFLWGTPAPILV